MTSKQGLRRGAGNAPASKINSAVSGSGPNTPAAPASKAGALAALRRSLATASEPALRERLTAVIASLEKGRAA